MQTYAEKYLIEKVIELIGREGRKKVVKILNVGAAKSLVVEKGIRKEDGDNVICDRMDIDDCRVDYPMVGQCFRSSVESMLPIKSNEYQIAFANYVFEHVPNLKKAAAECARVLKPSGYLIMTLFNPTASEFIVSKYTPTAFHQFIKGRGKGAHAHETHYAYKNIKQFISMSQLYDNFIGLLGIKALMGNVCIVFRMK